MELVNIILDNKDMLADLGIFAFNCLTGTVFGASVITAITKTQNKSWYKVIEALAIVVKHAKDKK